MTINVVERHKSVGPVGIGMTRGEVLGLFPEPPTTFKKTGDSKTETFAFRDASIHVYFDAETGSVEFIEAFPADKVEFVVAGHNILETPAEQLIAILDSTYNLQTDEDGCSIILAGNDVSLWRSDPDAEYFESVGVGVAGYYGNAV
jgi:hypothetical protein